MAMHPNEKKWFDEFKEFAETESVAVPESITQNILKTVHRDLNPSSLKVFAKLFSVHLFVGTLSLAVCDQFGMSPFKTEFSLSEYFMRFGHSFCMVMCGYLFIGLSVTISSFFLSREEFRVVGRHGGLQVFLLSIFSLVIFAAFGADFAIGFGLLWVLGAILGGFSVLGIAKLRMAAVR